MESTKTRLLEKQIISLARKRELLKLEDVIEKTDTEQLIDLLIKKLPENGVLLWDSILLGFSSKSTKRFKIVMAVLEHMNKIEITTKINFEIVTRLFIELQKFSMNELIEICEFCIDCIRIGDSKCIGWKDLLPEVMTIISSGNDDTSITVNGVHMSGHEYRLTVIKNLFAMKWPNSVLTPISSMFRDFPISKDERTTIIGKLCDNMQRLNPIELPALAFQLFSLCSTASLIIIPILSFQKYFHKHYFKKLVENMDSETTDYDSIDKNSDEEFREAEELILYHLQNCTEYRISEKEIVTIFKNISAIPEYILTPFVVGAVLIMCNINRYPESNRLASSQILPFLRNIIKNNEDEKELANKLIWCRELLDFKIINLDKIFSLLIEQSSKDSMDMITPGLVGLSFILLRTKNSPQLNLIGSKFLHKFMNKRFIFADGIVKNLADCLFVDQDAIQYAECLTSIIISEPSIISECTETFIRILDYFLIIPGQNAMRIMSCIFQTVKLSHQIRDALIIILRQAMYHKNLSTRQMGVYGFCMLLKLLKNNNSRRANSSLFSQNRISGLSLMSQATMSSTDNSQRYFDLLALEIVGILQLCFREKLEVKEILYEGLTRSIGCNRNATPHILRFIDWHFRSYFVIDEINIDIKFNLLILERKVGDGGNNDDDVEIEILDNLGLLIQFVGYCVYMCDLHLIRHDNTIIKQLLKSLLDRIDVISLESLGVIGSLDQRTNTIGSQFLNCLEALMDYALWMTKTDNDFLQRLLKLFKYHMECTEQMKQLCSSGKKKINKKQVKTTTAGDLNATTSSISSQLKQQEKQRAIVFKPINIWELSTLERFLKLLHEPTVTFASSNQTTQLKSNREFGRYILRTTIKRIDKLQLETDYHQVQHSSRIFNILTEIIKILYENSIKTLINVCKDYDVTIGLLSIECFKQCLTTVHSLYNKKFNNILEKIIPDTNVTSTNKIKQIIVNLQELLLKFIDGTSIVDAENADELEKIPPIILQSLEILYNYVPSTEIFALEIYNWLEKFCIEQNINDKNLNLIHKLLFEQRMRTKTGPFYHLITAQIEKQLGQIIDDDKLQIPIKYKSITKKTIDTLLIYLFDNLKRQIEIIEYFIIKIKSLYSKLLITDDSNNNDYDNCLIQMKLIERSIISQLLTITNTLKHLTNTQLPLGNCMDLLMKFLIQLFVCLTNLTKHFTTRSSLVTYSLRNIQFDQLIRSVGKSLVSRIYDLISYIESNSEVTTDGENVGDDIRKKKKSELIALKAKVLKETKYVPRLILRIENFNKFIILLSKKIKEDLSLYLHIGTVRDFKIKTVKLKEAVKRVKNVNNSDNEDDSSDKDDGDDGDADEDEEEEGSDEVVEEDEVTNINENNDEVVVEEPNEIPPTNTSVISELTDQNSLTARERVLKNLEKINSKSLRKRKSDEIIERNQPAKIMKIIDGNKMETSSKQILKVNIEKLPADNITEKKKKKSSENIVKKVPQKSEKIVEKRVTRKVVDDNVTDDKDTRKKSTRISARLKPILSDDLQSSIDPSNLLEPLSESTDNEGSVEKRKRRSRRV